MEYKIYRTDELYHHGIKGMRWGIRRFQRKDGSLTPAGQKRRARLESELKQLSPKKRKTKAEVEQAARKKTVYEMTDAELRERTNRMRIEKEYYDAQKNLAIVNPPQISKGKKFMNSLVNDVVAPAAKTVGKAWLESFMKDKLGLVSIDDRVKKAKALYEIADYNEKRRKINERDENLEELAKKAKYEYEIADYNEKLKNVGKPKEDKIDWESKNKEQNYIKNQKAVAEAQEEYERYLEEKRKREQKQGDE